MLQTQTSKSLSENQSAKENQSTKQLVTAVEKDKHIYNMFTPPWSHKLVCKFVSVPIFNTVSSSCPPDNKISDK